MIKDSVFYSSCCQAPIHMITLPTLSVFRCKRVLASTQVASGSRVQQYHYSRCADGQNTWYMTASSHAKVYAVMLSKQGMIGPLRISVFSTCAQVLDNACNLSGLPICQWAAHMSVRYLIANSGRRVSHTQVTKYTLSTQCRQRRQPSQTCTAAPAVCGHL